MKTMQFIRDYLKGEARITIADDYDDIWYEGDAMSLQPETVKGTRIAEIKGLGYENDIIIVIVEE